MNPEIESAISAAVASALTDYAQDNPAVVRPSVIAPSIDVALYSNDDATQNISEEENQLRLFVSLNLPTAVIARKLGVSRPTVYAMMEKHNLRQTDKYSVISDDNLDEVISSIKRHHPSSGQVMVQGHLVAQGVVVQRHRVRKSLARVDACGIRMRRLHTIRRRVYSVPGPNFLWHIDGTHKLIRWGMVVHAAIDGYSRVLVFAQCSNNNRAHTVETLFERARQKYGNPLRVRTDEGGENVGVWNKMNLLYETNSNPVIVGSSVHNQRIERAHRDLNEQVINRYYNLFYELEHSGQLNLENAIDLFCLHYVFIAHVNQSLCEFVLAHNNHKISTEGNYTPLQLFLANYHLRQGLTQADQNFQGGIALSALDRANLPHVQVPPIKCPLSEEQLSQLRVSVDPLAFDDAVVAFRQTARYVANCLRA